MGPRRVFRRLAHSLSQERNRDSKTRQGLTYNIPYNYRKHEAHLRRHQANTETRRVVSGGPHEEGVGPSPPFPGCACGIAIWNSSCGSQITSDFGGLGGNLDPAASSRPPPKTALARFGLLFCDASAHLQESGGLILVFLQKYCRKYKSGFGKKYPKITNSEYFPN